MSEATNKKKSKKKAIILGGAVFLSTAAATSGVLAYTTVKKHNENTTTFDNLQKMIKDKIALLSEEDKLVLGQAIETEGINFAGILSTKEITKLQEINSTLNKYAYNETKDSIDKITKETEGKLNEKYLPQLGKEEDFASNIKKRNLIKANKEALIKAKDVEEANQLTSELSKIFNSNDQIQSKEITQEDLIKATTLIQEALTKESNARTSLDAFNTNVLEKIGETNKEKYQDEFDSAISLANKRALKAQLEQYNDALTLADQIENPIQRHKFIELIKNANIQALPNLLAQVKEQVQEDYVDVKESFLKQLDFLDKEVKDPALKAKLDELKNNKNADDFLKKAEELKNQYEQYLVDNLGENALSKFKKDEINNIIDTSTLDQATKTKLLAELEKTNSNADLNQLRKQVIDQVKLQRTKDNTARLLELINEPLKTQLKSKMNDLTSTEEVRKLQDEAFKVYDNSKNEFDKAVAKLADNSKLKNDILKDVIAKDNVDAYTQALNTINDMLRQERDAVLKYAKANSDLLNNPEFKTKWIDNFDATLPLNSSEQEILSKLQELKKDALNSIIDSKLANQLANVKENDAIKALSEEIKALSKNGDLPYEEKLAQSQAKLKELQNEVNKAKFANLSDGALTIHDYKEKAQLLADLEKSDTEKFLAIAQFNNLNRNLEDNENLVEALGKIQGLESIVNDYKAQRDKKSPSETRDILLGALNTLKTNSSIPSDKKKEAIDAIVKDLGFKLSNEQKLQLTTEPINDATIDNLIDELQNKTPLRNQIASVLRLAQENASTIIPDYENIKAKLLDPNATKAELETIYAQLTPALNQAFEENSALKTELSELLGGANDLINDLNTPAKINFDLISDYLNPSLVDNITNTKNNIAKAKETLEKNRADLSALIAALPETHKDKNLDINSLNPGEIQNKLSELNQELTNAKNDLLKKIYDLDHDNPNKKGLALLVDGVKNLNEIAAISSNIEQSSQLQDVKKEAANELEKLNDQVLVNEYLKKLSTTQEKAAVDALLAEVKNKVAQESSYVADIKASITEKISRIQDPAILKLYESELTNPHSISSIDNLLNNVNNYLALQESNLQDARRQGLNTLAKLKIDNPLREELENALNNASTFVDLEKFTQQGQDVLDNLNNNLSDAISKLAPEQQAEYKAQQAAIETEAELEQKLAEVNNIIQATKDKLINNINNILNTPEVENYKHQLLAQVNNASNVSEFNSIENELFNTLAQAKNDAKSFTAKFNDPTEKERAINAAGTLAALKTLDQANKAELDNIYKQAQRALSIVNGSPLQESYENKLATLSNTSSQAELDNFINEVNQELASVKASLEARINALENETQKAALRERLVNATSLTQVASLAPQVTLQEAKEVEIAKIRANATYPDQVEDFITKINGASSLEDLQVVKQEVAAKEIYNKELEAQKSPVNDLLKNINVNTELKAQLQAELDNIRDKNDVAPLQTRIDQYINNKRNDAQNAINKLEGDENLKASMQQALGDQKQENKLDEIIAQASAAFDSVKDNVNSEIAKIKDSAKRAEFETALANKATIKDLNELKEQVKLEQDKESLTNLLENVLDQSAKEALRQEIAALTQRGESVTNLQSKINEQIKKDKGELEAARIEAQQVLDRISPDNPKRAEYEQKLQSNQKSEVEALKSELEKVLNDKNSELVEKLKKLEQPTGVVTNSNALSRNYNQIKTNLEQNKATLTEAEYAQLEQDIQNAFNETKAQITEQLAKAWDGVDVAAQKTAVESQNFESGSANELINQYSTALQTLRNDLVSKLDGFKQDGDKKKADYQAQIDTLVSATTPVTNWSNNLVDQLVELKARLEAELESDKNSFEAEKLRLLAKKDTLSPEEAKDLETKINAVAKFEDFAALDTEIDTKLAKHKTDAQAQIQSLLEAHPEKDQLISLVDSKGSYADVQNVLNDAKTKFNTKRQALLDSLNDPLITEAQKQELTAALAENTATSFAKLLEVENKILVEKQKTNLRNKIANIEGTEKKSEFEQAITNASDLNDLNQLETQIDEYKAQEADELSAKKQQANDYANKLNDVAQWKAKIQAATTKAGVDKLLEDMQKIISNKQQAANNALNKLSGHPDYASLAAKYNPNLSEAELDALISEYSQAFNDHKAKVLAQYNTLTPQDNFDNSGFDTKMNAENATIADLDFALKSKQASSNQKRLLEEINKLPESLKNQYSSQLQNTFATTDDPNQLDNKVAALARLDSEIANAIADYTSQKEALKQEIDALLARVQETNKSNEFNQTKITINYHQLPELNALNNLKQDAQNYLVNLQANARALLENSIDKDGTSQVKYNELLDKVSDTSSDTDYNSVITELNNLKTEYKKKSTDALAKIENAPEYQTLLQKAKDSELESIHNDVVTQATKLYEDKKALVTAELEQLELDDKAALQTELNDADTWTKLNTLETKIKQQAREQVELEINKLPANERTQFEQELALATSVAQINEIKKRVKEQVVDNEVKTARAQALVEINKLWDADKDKLTQEIYNTRDIDHIKQKAEEAKRLLTEEKAKIDKLIQALPEAARSGFENQRDNEIYPAGGNAIKAYTTTLETVKTRVDEFKNTYLPTVSHIQSRQSEVEKELTFNNIKSDTNLQLLKDKYTDLNNTIETFKTTVEKLPKNNSVRTTLTPSINNNSGSDSLNKSFYETKTQEALAEQSLLDAEFAKITDFANNWVYNAEAKTTALNAINDKTAESVNSVDKIRAIYDTLVQAKNAHDAKLTELRNKLLDLPNDHALAAQINALINSNSDDLNSVDKISAKIAEIDAELQKLYAKNQELEQEIAKAHKLNPRVLEIKNLDFKDPAKNSEAAIQNLIDEVKQIQTNLQAKGGELKTYVEANFANPSETYTEFSPYFNDSTNFNDLDNSSTVEKLDELIQRAKDKRATLDSKINEIKAKVANIYDETQRQQYLDILNNNKHDKTQSVLKLEELEREIDQILDQFNVRKQEVLDKFANVPNNNDALNALKAKLQDINQTRTLDHIQAIETELETFIRDWTAKKDQLRLDLTTKLGAENDTRKGLEPKLNDLNEESINSIEKIDALINQITTERSNLDNLINEFNAILPKIPSGGYTFPYDSESAVYARSKEDTQWNLANIGDDTKGLTAIVKFYKEHRAALEAKATELDNLLKDTTLTSYTNDTLLKENRDLITDFNSDRVTSSELNSVDKIQARIASVQAYKTRIEQATTKHQEYTNKLHSSNEILVANPIANLNELNIANTFETRANNLETEYNKLLAIYNEINNIANTQMHEANEVATTWKNAYFNNVTTGNEVNKEALSNETKLLAEKQKLETEIQAVGTKRSELNTYVESHYPIIADLTNDTLVDAEVKKMVQYHSTHKTEYDKLVRDNNANVKYWSSVQLTAEKTEAEQKITEYDKVIKPKEFGKSALEFTHPGITETENLPNSTRRRYYATLNGHNRYISQLLPTPPKLGYFEWTQTPDQESTWTFKQDSQTRDDSSHKFNTLTAPVKEGLWHYRIKDSNGNIVDDNLSIVGYRLNGTEPTSIQSNNNNNTTTNTGNVYNQVGLKVVEQYSTTYGRENFHKLLDNNHLEASRWDSWGAWGQDDHSPYNFITFAEKTAESEKTYGQIELRLRVRNFSNMGGNIETFPAAIIIQYSKDGKQWRDVDDQSHKHPWDWFNYTTNEWNNGIVSLSKQRQNSGISRDHANGSVVKVNIKFRPVDAKYIKLTWISSSTTDGKKRIIGFTDVKLFSVDKNQQYIKDWMEWSSIDKHKDNILTKDYNFTVKYNDQEIYKTQIIGEPLSAAHKDYLLNSLLVTNKSATQTSNAEPSSSSPLQEYNSWNESSATTNLNPDRTTYTALGTNNAIASFYKTYKVDSSAFNNVTDVNEILRKIKLTFNQVPVSSTTTSSATQSQTTSNTNTQPANFNEPYIYYDIHTLALKRSATGAAITHASFVINIYDPATKDIVAKHFLNLVSDETYTKSDQTVHTTFNDKTTDTAATKHVKANDVISDSKYSNANTNNQNAELGAYNLFANSIYDKNGALRRFNGEISSLETSLAEPKFAILKERFTRFKTWWDQVPQDTKAKFFEITKTNDSTPKLTTTHMNLNVANVTDKGSYTEVNLNTLINEFFVIKNQYITEKLMEVNIQETLNDKITEVKQKFKEYKTQVENFETNLKTKINEIDSNAADGSDKKAKYYQEVIKLAKEKYGFDITHDPVSGLTVNSFMYNSIYQEIMNSQIKSVELLDEFIKLLSKEKFDKLIETLANTAKGTIDGTLKKNNEPPIVTNAQSAQTTTNQSSTNP